MALVFVPSNLLEQREREREQIRSGIKKVSINGGGMIDNLSRDNVRVVAYAARRVSANLSSL